MDNELINQLDLDKIQQQLRREHKRLREQIRQRRSPEQGSDYHNRDRSDLASDYPLQERESALQLVKAQKLAQIEDALNRIKAGNYGQCIACGTTIAPERLMALPSATLCMSCQQQS